MKMIYHRQVVHEQLEQGVEEPIDIIEEMFSLVDAMCNAIEDDDSQELIKLKHTWQHGEFDPNKED